MNTLELLNKRKPEKGALDGSDGVKVRYYRTTYQYNDIPQASIHRTLNDLFEFLEQVMLLEVSVTCNITSVIESIEEFNRRFPQWAINPTS